MDIYVYSDESGVFDKAHNEYFIFGGVTFLSKQERDICSRKYSAVERILRNSEKYAVSQELKAASVRNSDKDKLYRSLNSVNKFGIVIDQKRVLDNIFKSKKDKQRYLDYAYKIGVKRHFKNLISNQFIDPLQVERLYFFVDEHTTATNGCYELREGLLQEFKFGTYNWNYQIHYPSIFPYLKEVQLSFCNSVSTILVRSADIVANKIYYLTTHGIEISRNNLFISRLP